MNQTIDSISDEINNLNIVRKDLLFKDTNLRKASQASVGNNTSINNQLLEEQLHVKFEDITSRLPAHQRSLGKIKQTYDTALLVQKDNLKHKNTDFLAKLNLRQVTIENIRKREAVFDKRINYLESEKQGMMGKIAHLRKKKLELNPINSKKKVLERPKKSTLPLNHNQIVSSLIKQGILFNSSSLEMLCERKRMEIDNLESAKNVSFRPIIAKEKLLSDFTETESNIASLIQMNDKQRFRFNLLSNATHFLSSHKRNPKSPFDTYKDLYSERAEVNSNKLEIENIFDETENEIMVDFQERFNQLFDSEKYYEAAIQAANSPYGFLRTMEIIDRFSLVSDNNSSGKSLHPLVYFCEALLVSVPTYMALPHDISIITAQILLLQDRFDFLVQCIFQEYFTFSEQLGLVFYIERNNNPKCLSLAHFIFSKIYSRLLVGQCLLRMNRNFALFEYVTINFDFKTLMEFICFEPNLEKCNLFLYPPKNFKPFFTLSNALLALLQQNIVSVAYSLYKYHFTINSNHRIANSIGNHFEIVETKTNEWNQISELFVLKGQREAGEEILACLISKNAIQIAVTNFIKS